jgi:hypothetical protein
MNSKISLCICSFLPRRCYLFNEQYHWAKKLSTDFDSKKTYIYLSVKLTYAQFEILNNKTIRSKIVGTTSLKAMSSLVHLKS